MKSASRLTMIIMVILLMLTACQTTALPTAVPITNPTNDPVEIPTIIPGPESFPEAPASYPQSLSVEQVKSLLEQKPERATGALLLDPGVEEIHARHREWVEHAGLQNIKLVAVTTIDGRWFFEILNGDDSIAGWLKIEDNSSQTGWRYGELPTYDSQFNPSQDKFTFGLPELHYPENHFEMVYQGFPIIVEMSAKGEPQYWYNIVTNEIQMIEGARIVEPFKAGLPETLAGCNTLELEYLPDGSIDLEWMKRKMREMSLVEHAWLKDQGITIGDIAAVGKSEMTGGEVLPYPRIAVQGSPILPVSCTTITDASGQEYQMYGFAVKAERENSDSITMLHVLYDHVGVKNNLMLQNELEFYINHFTPELTFTKIHDRTFDFIYVFLNRYGQNDGALSRWQMTKALIDVQQQEEKLLSNPQEQGGTPSLMFFLGGKYENVVPSAIEEAQWAKTIEEYVYPAQNFLP